MLKAKRQCKERTCFVPLCRSGYRSNEEKVSLFTAPTDPARLAEWESKINRADRRLTPKAVVCERHFESGYIERYFQTTVNARDKPRLKPDAVPTVFEDYPTHLVPKKAVKRKVRNICDQEPAPKQQKRNVELADPE
nr:THAP domain-containing protein 2-like [Rhipicephalus microplus]